MEGIESLRSVLGCMGDGYTRSRIVCCRILGMHSVAERVGIQLAAFWDGFVASASALREAERTMGHPPNLSFPAFLFYETL